VSAATGRHRRRPSWAPLVLAAVAYVGTLATWSAYATVVMAR
jgi:hypothetical protein